ncbi:MAG: hypothetical protein ACLQMH_05855, partial [Solirubrobacteraceae bacterium]
MADADTPTALSPPDGGVELHGTLFSDGLVGPYSNLHSLIVPPLGLTVAFSVAVVWAIRLAFSVTAVGAFGSVVKLFSLAPGLRPEPFVA